MNTLKNVGNKLFLKQELSTEKIELNMVKSVESNSLKAESLYEQGVKKIFSAVGEINSAIQTIEQSLKLAIDSINEGKEIEKLADNIGADLKPSTTKAIQTAFNTIQAAEQNIKDLNKAKATIL